MKKIIFSVIITFLITNVYAEDKKAVENVKTEKTSIKIKGDVLGDMAEEGVIKNPKVQALLQNAYAKGYTAGVNDAQSNMKSKLLAMENQLNRIFNFHQLVLEGKYIPPLIAVIKSPVEVSNDGKSMSVESRRYEVIEQGYFVDEIPTWKNFLLE